MKTRKTAMAQLLKEKNYNCSIYKPMRHTLFYIIVAIATPFVINAQNKGPVLDNFNESNAYNWWSYGDDSPLKENAPDPTDASNNVLRFDKNSKGTKDKYNGVGVTLKQSLDLKNYPIFKVKVLFPNTRSNYKIKDQTLTLKLMDDGKTGSEAEDNAILVVKPIILSDDWQTITFDLRTDDIKTKSGKKVKKRKDLNKIILVPFTSSGSRPATIYFDDFEQRKDY